MMRIDLAFDKPLNQEQKLRLRLGLGTLAKAKRVVVVRGDRLVSIYGDGLGSRSVRETLAADGLVPAKITSTLDPEADAACDESPEQVERVRAIGR